MCMSDVEMYVAQQQYNSWAQATLTVAVMNPETWLMGAWGGGPPPRRAARGRGGGGGGGGWVCMLSLVVMIMI